MAYETLESLPQNIQDTLPIPAQKIFMTAFNSATSDGINEEKAHEVAWSSVKNTFEQKENGQWNYKDENHDYTTTGTMPNS